MLSYPHKLYTALVDKQTHRVRYLTNKATHRLYLKQYLLQLKANKKINKKTNQTAVKNGIALLIVILTMNQPISANAYNPSIEAYKLYAHMMIGSDREYRCLVELWDRESHWNYKAHNTKSSAYGIPQLLHMKTTNPYRQIELGYKYITKRYKGSACKALAHHKRVGHY